MIEAENSVFYNS